MTRTDVAGGRDADAFNALFYQFYSPLVLFARKLIRDTPAAEDIVAEVFLKLWTRQTRFATLLSAKAFLYISTRNACVNHLHPAGFRAGVRQRLSHASEEMTEEHALHNIVQSEVLREVFAMVDLLPHQCRRIVHMSYILGLSNEQIAAAMQLSVHTVRNQKTRGLNLMRRRLRAAMAAGNPAVGEERAV